jgi:hypothetical protein
MRAGHILMLTAAVAAMATGIAVAAPAGADAPGPAAPPVGVAGLREPPPAYRDECGACHTAYPAEMLPWVSWQRLLAGLNRHFGSDAAIDAPSLAPVRAWLEQNAGRYDKTRLEPPPPQDRITLATWFVRKHLEVNEPVWLRPAIKGPGHCEACHTEAARGDFDEERVLIPR